MQKQVVGYLAVHLLVRSLHDNNRYEDMRDGMAIFSEAIGEYLEELKEAIRIAGKYRDTLYFLYYRDFMTKQETWQMAIKMVEQEIGEELQAFRKEGERWKV